jgi:rhodanese-related sulfurtransferase
VSDISQTDFAAARQHGRIQVVDVREDGEFASGHVPGAVSIPMGQLTNRLAEIDQTQPVYVICASGGRSAVTSDVLVQRGFDAYSVVGGTRAWTKTGQPVHYDTNTSITRGR